jgi:hypothetical protein
MIPMTNFFAISSLDLKVGKFCFSLCIILYLYGDLAIYCTAVAKSLRDVTCTATTGTEVLFPVQISLP